MLFSQLGLSKALLDTLDGLHLTTPTPIQVQAIPPVLEGRDVIGLAQTGTGKTAAFALPILHRLAPGKPAAPKKVRALILSPTRELSAQIAKSVKDYGRKLNLSSAVVVGGVSSRPQIKALAGGVDILIATPGRLMDLIEQRTVSLNEVEVVVLDEADQMLDIGFMPAIKRLLAMTPQGRQTLLFSATMPKEIRQLSDRHLKDPIEVSVIPAKKTADRVEHSVMHMQTPAKMGALASLIRDRKGERVIVFTRTKRGADKAVKRLETDGINAAAIHGNKSQGQRERALAGFRAGTVPVLIATDIAARGIDVPGVSLVVNYELPNVPEVYVHRIGRTARLGAEGDAISFACDLYAMSLPDIETYIGQSIPVASMDPALLVMPKSRAVDAEFAANAAADSAEFGDVVPPRPGEKPRRGGAPGAHGGRGSSDSRRSPRPPRERKPRVTDATAAQSTDVAVQPAAAAPAAAPAAAGDEVKRKPRRRRGGRNRRREGAPTDGVERTTQQADHQASSARAPRGERRPPRERKAAEATGTGHSRPSRQVAVTSAKTAEHAHQNKPGLFRRLTRLFTGK
jgi:superfamily II DNA/RNA helicase